MSRAFVVVRKTVAIVTNFNGRFIELDELRGLEACHAEARRRRVDLLPVRPGLDLSRAENRIERILRKDVLDVSDEQLLMLLFVMNSEREERLDLARQFFFRGR